MASLRLTLLGGLEARLSSGQPLALPPRKTGALLAYLAMPPGRARSREELMARFWSQRSERQARNSLRQALFALRRNLAPLDAPVLRIDGETVTLDPAHAQVDVLRFEELAERGTAHALRQATALYRGELLEGVVVRDPAFDEWLFYERERVRELAVRAHAKLLAHEMQSGPAERAIDTAHGLLRLDPLREETHRALMRLYAGQARWSAAARQYRVCRELLQQELGIEPEPESAALHEQIRERRLEDVDVPPSATREDPPSEGSPEEAPAAGRDETGVSCVRCRAANTDEAEYCVHCGARLALRCRKCGSRNRPAVSFCGQCGTSLLPYEGKGVSEEAAHAPDEMPAGAVEPEHRQLTVMYCELVGTARLGPEALQEAIGSYQDRCTAIVEALGGSPARYVGGGLLAYFGYPKAHEEDAERAVEAGLDVVDAVAALRDSFAHDEASALAVRVGISTGMVVAGDLVGERASEAGAVLGETPEIAMRLCRLSDPNTVVIGPETRRLAAGRFDYLDLGDRTLDDVEGPVRVWQVVAGRRAVSRFEAMHGGPLTSLVGRAEELALLLRRWELAKNGEGQVVLISGEPGIGKSRLAHTLRERILDETHSCIQHQCSAYHQSSAFYPVITQLEQDAGFLPDDATPVRQDKLRRLTVGHREEDVEEQIALLASLLSVPAPSEHAALELGRRRRKEATLELMLRRVRARAAASPVLCIFEDVHWLDPSTRDLLERLVEEVPELPVLLLLTFRPEFEPPWTDRAQTTHLTIGRMNPSECREMISELAGGRSLPVEVYDGLITKGEGVPLFVEELTKLALSSGLHQAGQDADESAGALPPLAIPATLQDSLTARLDQVGSAKEVAQMGALIGREFSIDLLAAVASWSDDELGSALGRLQESGLVFRRSSAAGATYVFKHALIQEAARSTLLPGHRRHLHTRIASALDAHFPDIAETRPELLARHYTEAALTEQAIDYWRRAGERAAGRAGHLEAISHFSEGLALLGKLPDSIARARREAALRIAAAQSMRIVDRVPDALDHLEHAERVTSAHGLTLERSRIHHLRGNLYFPLGDINACMNEHRLALQYGREAESVEQEARALGGLGDAEYARGRMLSAYGYFSRCVEMCREEGFEDIEVANLPMAGTTRHYRNEMHEALDDALRAYEGARRIRNIRAMILARACASYPLFELAQYDRMVTFADEMLELAGRLGARGWQSAALDHKARALHRQGKRAEAFEAARQALEMSRQATMQFVGPRALSLVVLLAKDSRQREKAQREAEALLRAGSVAHNHLWFHRYAIEVALEQKSWRDAERHATELERYTRSEPLPLIDFYIAQARALAMHGKDADREAAHHELFRLREQAKSENLWNALQALEEALSGG